MKLKDLAITATLAIAVAGCVGWAQQATDSQSPPETGSKPAKNAPKEKHWSGSLVDLSCMAKALGASSAASPQAGPAPEAPHFTGEGAPSPQVGGQAPGGGAPGGMGPGQTGQGPGPPTSAPMPGTGPDQRSQADQQASRVDSAAKSCAASPSTQTLGLATSGGQVMQFDPDGNAKAKDALKEADVQPGKKIKAKVTGLMEDNTTVKVASVNVKGKGKGKGK